MDLFSGSIYTGVLDRNGDVAGLMAALEKIKIASLTVITPEVRETLLRSILSDLSPETPPLAGQIGSENDASIQVWRKWPEELITSALDTVKILGRNPSGSEILATKRYLAIPAFHAGLLTGSRTDRTWSPARSHAVAIIANALRLFESPALDAAQDLGVGTMAIQILQTQKATAEMTFLLGRVLMLMTSRSKAGPNGADEVPYIKRFVELDGGVRMLEKYLSTYSRSELLIPYAVSWTTMALEELLRLAYHVLALYPDVAANDESLRSNATISVEEMATSLLPPLLHLLWRIPRQEPVPPISYVVNCLGRIPITDQNKEIWSKPRSGDSSPASESIAARTVAVVENYLNASIPGLPWQPDDPAPQEYGNDGKIAVDEQLPPSLLLLTNLAASDEKWRQEIRNRVIPRDLDRAPDSAPLEKRPTTLGVLLRFLRSSTYPITQMTLGELFWTICGSDSATLAQEIGYGNAAGLLFNKGMPAPPAPAPREAHIEELPADDNDVADRNIITALKDDTTAPLATDEMTDEDKEREAEKIMSYFDRMERNPAMQMVQNPMKEAVASGRADEWDKREADEEQRRQIKQDQEDEEEAMREMAAYKARKRR